MGKGISVRYDGLRIHIKIRDEQHILFNKNVNAHRKDEVDGLFRDAKQKLGVEEDDWF